MAGGSPLDAIRGQEEDMMTGMSETDTVNLIGGIIDIIDGEARPQLQVAVEAEAVAVASVAAAVRAEDEPMMITDALAADLPVSKASLLG